MFPYTEKYTESEYDVQNINLLYKTHHKCQNTFEMLENVGSKGKFQKTYFVIYIIL